MAGELEDIGTRLREERDRVGISQRELNIPVADAILKAQEYLKHLIHSNVSSYARN